MNLNVEAEASPPQQGPDGSDASKTRSASTLALCCAAACGTLVGFAEVLWSYRLPEVTPTWRAILPASFGGLAQFLAIACITNVLLFSLATFASISFLRLVRFACRQQSTSKPRPLLTRWCVITGGLGYLFVGWLGLFVLVMEATGYLLFAGYAAATLVAAAGVALPIAWLLGYLRRRVHRSMPLVCFLFATGCLFAAIVPAFGRYRASLPPEPDVPYSPEGVRFPVVLITLDTLRADYLACYGNTRIKTPALDALASDGVIFEQAISQSPTTTPSHCSIMTSLYPNKHDGWNGRPMKPGLLTLADVFRGNGFRTAAFTSATTTRSINSGLQQGFDLYNDSLVPWASWFYDDKYQNLIFFYLLGVSQDSQIRGEVVTGRFTDWLSDTKKDDFFVWLHYFDPHAPYDAPGSFLDKYRGSLDDGLPMREERELYAGEIAYTDRQVGVVCDALKKRGMYDDALIIVVADHGEAFGEKHWDYTDVGHGKHLYDVTQRVPLIVKPPLGLEPGRRIDEQVELIDIAPTILALMRIEVPEGFGGKPLHELIEGRPYSYADRPAYSTTWVSAQAEDPEDGMVYVQLMAHRTSDWKYIYLSHFDQEELYNLKRDPSETRNVYRTNPRIIAPRKVAIETTLRQEHDMKEDPRGGLAPHLLRQLQGLGYLKGESDEEDD